MEKDLICGCQPFRYNNKYTFISKFVDCNPAQSWIRARKERQLAPQASAGYPLSKLPLLPFRNVERGPEKKDSEK
jgi:hypothetical protein